MSLIVYVNLLIYKVNVRKLLQVRVLSEDCHCNRIHGICYSAALAALEEAAEGEKVTDPRYGAFLVLTLTPTPLAISVNSSQG